LSGNSAVQRGGAIYFYTGTLSIDSSTLSGNQSAEDGGAIAFYGDGTTGTLTMTNSTLSGNKATGMSGRGGAIFLYRSLASTITNSTISGNTSSGPGGGINLYKAAPLTMSNSTMSGNTAAGNGGAVYLETSTLNLASTIVANSVDRVGTRDIFDATLTTVNADHSLIQNGLGFIVNSGTANIIGQNPLLGPLANNGGPTQTHALLAGSPAIDTGSNPLTLSTDQRGAGFGRTFNGTTDIGAFEVQAAAPPLPPQLAQIPTLSQWGLAILGVLTAGVAFLTGFGRRRRD
jgi:predicted outer membrane repeat protein